MKNLRIVAAVVLAIWVVALAQSLLARPAHLPAYSTKMYDYVTLNKNNILLPVTNKGEFGQNPLTGRAGTEWPIGSGNFYVFGAGLWLGCKLVKNNVAHYPVDVGYNPNDGSFEFAPGPIGSSITDPNYHCFLSDRDAANWPVVDNTGKAVIKSVQDSWCDFNDGNITTHDAFDTAGTELMSYIKLTTYAWNYPSNANIIFLVYEIYNQGTVPWDSAYVGVTFDPDLGNAVDDMVASDSSRNLAWVYNSTSSDQDINGTPGLFGSKFIESPKGLTSFTIFTLSSDPRTDLERYHAMAGLTFSGDRRPGGPYDHDVAPEDKRFGQASGPFTLNPGDSTRVVVAMVAAPAFDPGSWDPTTLANNLKQVADNAQAIYNSNFNLPAAPEAPVVKAVNHNGKVYLNWSTLSETTPDPYYPIAHDSAGPFYDPFYQEFDLQGYRVYRSQTGFPDDWTKLAEYDRQDGIKDGGDPFTISATVWHRDSAGAWVSVDSSLDVYPDIDTNATEFGPQAYRYHIGTDDGLTHAFIDSSVVPGFTYYYAVTAYDWQPGRPHTLESGKNKVIVRPKSDPAGWVNGEVNVEHLSPGLDQPRAGKVEVELVDPVALTGHTYDIIFQRRNAPSDGAESYALVDVTTGDTLYKDATNQSGNSEYPTTDGFIAKVFQRPNYALSGPACDAYGLDTAATQALGGSLTPELNITEEVVWGTPDYYGPYADWDDFQIVFEAATMVQAVVHDSLVPAEDSLRIYYMDAQGDTMWAIRRRFSAAGFPGYGYNQTRISVPFALYDLGNGPGQTPLRVWPIVYDYPVLVSGRNMIWDVTDNIVKPDHYIYMMPDPNDNTRIFHADAYNNGNPEYMYQIVPPNANNHLTGSYRVAFDLAAPTDTNFWHSKQAYTFHTINGNEPGDVYAITTKAAHIDVSLAKSELDAIKVVPNPYLVRNQYEIDPNNSVIRFTHLPEVCTIRIYTTSGNMIKTISHNLPGSLDGEEVWNVLTYNDQIPASGMYVFTVEAPGMGSKTGRFAIIK